MSNEFQKRMEAAQAQQDEASKVTRGEFKKADAFANMVIEFSKEDTEEIGGIALYVSNNAHKQLMALTEEQLASLTIRIRNIRENKPREVKDFAERMKSA